VASAWPNLFIVGAAKAGTTSLAYYLSQHADVFMSKMKEPHYFSAVRPEGKFAHAVPVVSDQASYLRLFQGAEGFRYRAEASTSYLWSEDAAARIAERSPDARIIAVLREPIERLHSHYLNEVREGIETRPIERAVREDFDGHGRWGKNHLYVECGLYSRQLERYLEAFPRGQLLVLFQDELKSHTQVVVEQALRFLGIDPSAAARIDVTPKNTYAAPPPGLVRRLRASPFARRMYRSLVPARRREAVRENLMFVPAEKPPIPADALSFLHEIYREELSRFPQSFERRPDWLRDLSRYQA
jgi:hypothetical protein